MNQPVAISTHELTVGYQHKAGDHVLLKKLNLELGVGELVSFMGPNGIGKSTLIRTLAQIRPPLGGVIRNQTRQKGALVLTDRVQSQAMKVHELVSYGRYPYLSWTLRMNSNDMAKVQAAMERLRIIHLAEQRIAELSDGQMQMVMIARALAQDTTLMLLDEPTAHLDLNNRVEVMSLLREIAREENKAILVATHELDLALQTSDLIWLATNDKSIKTGLPEDLVLDGSFDEVFQFKGFDLRTGKVVHQPFRKSAIRLGGDGPVYLWTKNALERTGFTVGDVGELSITIQEGPPLAWKLSKQNSVRQASSIGELIRLIEKGD